MKINNFIFHLKILKNLERMKKVIYNKNKIREK